MSVPTVTYFHGSANPNAKNCEGSRLSSFSHWVFQVFAIRLASAGFHATGREDEVECSWCGLKKRGWTADERPDDVHKRLSPHCTFYNDDNCSSNSPLNVPIPRAKHSDYELSNELNVYLKNVGWKTESGIQERDQVDSSDVDVNIRQVLGVTIRPPRRRRTSTNPQPPASVPKAANGITVPFTARCLTHQLDGPRFPDYADEDRRRRSFERGFPRDKRVLVEPMCKSGFFYIGCSDNVACFQCGLSLQEWRVGGGIVQDEPKLVHARWRPACFQVRPDGGSRLALYIQRELQLAL